MNTWTTDNWKLEKLGVKYMYIHHQINSLLNRVFIIKDISSSTVSSTRCRLLFKWNEAYGQKGWLPLMVCFLLSVAMKTYSKKSVVGGIYPRTHKHIYIYIYITIKRVFSWSCTLTLTKWTRVGHLTSEIQTQIGNYKCIYKFYE